MSRQKHDIGFQKRIKGRKPDPERRKMERLKRWYKSRAEWPKDVRDWDEEQHG